MSVAALLPLYLAGAARDTFDLTAATCAIRDIQFRAAQMSRGYNLDLIAFNRLFIGTWPSHLKPLPLDSDPLVFSRAAELIGGCKQAKSDNEPEVLSAVRFADREATARWMGRGPHTRMSQDRHVPNWTASPLPKDPPDIRSAVRLAYRTLRHTYPAPFIFKHYNLLDGEVTWSDQPSEGSIYSAHGLSITNIDLPQTFHETAERNHPDARYAYRVIELAHDIRGYASELTPERARAPLRHIDLSGYCRSMVLDWLLLVTLCEISAIAQEWGELRRRREKLQRKERGRAQGLREIAQYNIRRTSAAQQWQAVASAMATQLRAQDPHRTLKSIAEEICKKLSDQNAGSLKAETVNRFLRDDHPSLRRQARKSGSL